MNQTPTINTGLINQAPTINGFDKSNPYILHQFWLRDAHERKSVLENLPDEIDG